MPLQLAQTKVPDTRHLLRSLTDKKTLLSHDISKLVNRYSQHERQRISLANDKLDAISSLLIENRELFDRGLAERLQLENGQFLSSEFDVNREDNRLTMRINRHGDLEMRLNRLAKLADSIEEFVAKWDWVSEKVKLIDVGLDWMLGDWMLIKGLDVD